MWFVGVLKDGSAALTVEIFVHNLAVSHLDPMDLDGRWWEMWIKVKSLSIFFIVSPLNPIEPPPCFYSIDYLFFSQFSIEFLFFGIFSPFPSFWNIFIFPSIWNILVFSHFMPISQGEGLCAQKKLQPLRPPNCLLEGDWSQIQWLGILAYFLTIFQFWLFLQIIHISYYSSFRSYWAFYLFFSLSYF